MPDLRTRIADALQNMTGDLTHEAMADAVIAELGLPATWGRPSFDNGGQTKQYGPAPKIATRKADDE